MTAITSIVRRKGQLTLPQEIREACRLEEGDPVAFEVTSDGCVLIRPMKFVDASQTWFWTPEWQAGEREASDDISAGRVEIFKDDESFLASFE